MIKFEEKLEDINTLLKTRRYKWRLNQLAYMDYEDVCQIIRSHIYQKWDKWDQNKCFKRWCNRVISNQMNNLVRNNYGVVAPPCMGCPYNNGGDLCSYTKNGIKNSTCSHFSKWEKKKRAGYNIKLAQSLDCPDFCEQAVSPTTVVSEDAYNKATTVLKDKLEPKEFQFYLFSIGASESKPSGLDITATKVRIREIIKESDIF